jgi:hypothetical protein
MSIEDLDRLEEILEEEAEQMMEDNDYPDVHELDFN